MYFMSVEVVKFIEYAWQNWRFGLTEGRQILTEAKIQRGNFLQEFLLLSLFVMVKMQLNPKLKKCAIEYKLHKSQEKINHLMFIEDIKLFSKKKKKEKKWKSKYKH